MGVLCCVVSCRGGKDSCARGEVGTFWLIGKFCLVNYREVRSEQIERGTSCASVSRDVLVSRRVTLPKSTELEPSASAKESVSVSLLET